MAKKKGKTQRAKPVRLEGIREQVIKIKKTTQDSAAKKIRTAIETEIETVQFYPSFEGRKTIRKSKDAPNRVVYGKRDLIDSGDMWTNVKISTEGKNKLVTVDVPYATAIDAQTGFIDRALSKVELD